MIYVSSKLKHTAKWLALRQRGVPILSTWIDEPSEPPSFEDLWARCVREASTAKALICYAEDGDILKGGLVEVGAALGAGVPVFVINPQPGWTFTNHPKVTIVGSIEEAVTACGPLLEKP